MEGSEPVSVRPPDRRERAADSIRLVFGFLVIAVLVLAGLALINSFFLEPPAPQGPRTPAKQESGGDGGGGGVECDDVARVLLYVFIGLATSTAILFGVAVARRQHNNNRIATSGWGIGATIGFFFSLISLGTWRLIDVLCNEDVNCGNAVDGTYTAFLLLLGLTLGCFGFGIGFAFRTRRNFLLTGWGLIGVVLYVPTLLAAVFWYIIRVGCTADLSCALRDRFLDTLSTILWASLVAALLAFGVGYYFQRKLKFNLFASGFGVLGVCLLVMAGGAAYAHNYVDNLKIPFCDPIEPEEFNETVKSCVEIRDDLQGRLYTVLWLLLGIAVASTAIGVYLHRARLKEFWKSPWAIILYVAAALAFVTFLLILLTNSMCPGEGGDDAGGNGDGNFGDGGGRPGSGNGFGGGGGGGGGGGIGGAGAAPGSIPIQLGAIPLVWILVILGVLFAGALLLLLLKRRATLERLDAPPAPPTEVAAKERQSLMQILHRGEITSKEAVVAAYRSFLAWSDQRGVGKEAQETPMEHAMRVRQKYSIPDRPMRLFIDAYEVARLSHREPTPAERATAVSFSKEIDEVRPEPAPKKEGP